MQTLVQTVLIVTDSEICLEKALSPASSMQKTRNKKKMNEEEENKKKHKKHTKTQFSSLPRSSSPNALALCGAVGYCALRRCFQQKTSVVGNAEKSAWSFSV